MPVVTVEVLEGRTLEQKRNLVRDLVEAVSKNFKVKKEGVQVVIHESPGDLITHEGILIIDR